MKRTLIIAVALVVCLSTIIGGTLAWSTDEVTSANNVIQSGNLVDGQSIAGIDSLSNDVRLWEPGAVAWET